MFEGRTLNEADHVENHEEEKPESERVRCLTLNEGKGVKNKAKDQRAKTERPTEENVMAVVVVVVGEWL